MASVKRKSKAKRKSKSRSDDLDESLDGSLQLFSTQTVQSALDEQPTAIPTAQTASTTTEPSDNALPVKVKPQRTRVQQQLEARGEIKPLLKAILTSCQGCLGQLKSLRQRVEDGQMETEHGVSFLDVKQQVLMSYNLNLCLIVLRKLQGASLSSTPALKRLIRLRLLLEKLKPIDKKLQYQIDKLVKLAGSTAIAQGQHDALQLRPNPANLVPKDGQDDDSDDEADLEQQRQSSMEASGVYQPPRMTAMPYHEAETALLKKDREDRRQKRQMMASTVLKELRDEVSDRPMEIREQNESGVDNLRAQRFSTDAKEKMRYEEDNFVRLANGKKDKKRRNPRSELHDLAEFGSFKGYNDERIVNSSNRKSIRDQMKQVDRPKTEARKLKAKRSKRS